jgi:hypothetical protein
MFAHKNVDSPQCLCRLLWTDVAVVYTAHINNTHAQQVQYSLLGLHVYIVYDDVNSAYGTLGWFPWEHASGFIGGSGYEHVRDHVIWAQRNRLILYVQLAWQQVGGQICFGRGNPITWPPGSPDRNPPTFHLWGCLKKKVLVTEVQNRDDMINRTEFAASDNRDLSRQLITNRDSIQSRVKACIQE